MLSRQARIVAAALKVGTMIENRGAVMAPVTLAADRLVFAFFRTISAHEIRPLSQAGRFVTA
ncbi:hypothetical protein A5646_23375 [Mycobacterium sp. 1245499.0]|nr:hypothetical protein A5646_23375 [Mycobacterium sp. 1245499.0]